MKKTIGFGFGLDLDNNVVATRFVDTDIGNTWWNKSNNSNPSVRFIDIQDDSEEFDEVYWNEHYCSDFMTSEDFKKVKRYPNKRTRQNTPKRQN